MKVEEQFSAGGLVVRGDEILLISTHGGRRWHLPKGHVEEGESLEEAAIREVKEETGVTGRPLASLPAVEFEFTVRGTQRVRKRVELFLFDYVEGSAADFDPVEVSAAAWFRWEEGLAHLSFANERKVVELAREKMKTLRREESAP